MRTPYYILLLTLISLLAGCKENYNNFETGYGDIDIVLSVDPVISNIAGAKPISIEAPEVSNISIVAKGRNGNVRKWKNIEEFSSSRKMIPVDIYTFTASSGDTNSEGFITPVFAAVADKEIRDSELSTVELPCKVAGTLISTSLPKETALLKGISLRVKSNKGEYVDFPQGESRTASLIPGKIKAEAILTDNSGKTVAVQPIEIANSNASEHYEIRTEVKEENGVPQLSFVYDDATLASPATLVIDDEFFNSASPEIKTNGFSNNTTIANFEDNTPESPLTCTIEAESGLEHIFFTLASETFSDNPWTEETDLIGFQTDIAQRYGLEITGNFNGEKTATIDFTGLVALLPADGSKPATHTIIVQAQDKTGKICNEPAILRIETQPINLSLDKPQDIDIDDTKATVSVNYNGDSFSDRIALEYSEMLGDTWQPLTIESINRSDSNKYDVSFDMPENQSLIYIRAKYHDGAKYSDKVVLKRTLPDFKAICNKENIWPSKADIMISGEEHEKLIKYLNVYIKEANGDWHPAVIEKSPEESRITVSTLMPSTSYMITVSASSDQTQSLSITTESALSLPNGSFEDDLKETINISRINCGGRYSNINSWMPTYNTTSIKVREAKGWASVNAKTCSSYAKTENTWFKVPTTEIIETAYDGAYAIRLRNAAWDINGVEPPRDVRTDKIYYSSKVPTIANRSAGKLFLGSYTFFANGSERYDEGIEFNSRPTAISGHYYYRQDIHDMKETGLVEIKILHEEGNESVVIGEGTGYLPASTSFTAFSVPITYHIRNKQATKLCLMFASSNHASSSQTEESRNIKTSDNLEKGVSIGAELVIDNLNLLYE